MRVSETKGCKTITHLLLSNNLYPSSELSGAFETTRLCPHAILAGHWTARRSHAYLTLRRASWLSAQEGFHSGLLPFNRVRFTPAWPGQLHPELCDALRSTGCVATVAGKQGDAHIWAANDQGPAKGLSRVLGLEDRAESLLEAVAVPRANRQATHIHWRGERDEVVVGLVK